MKATSSPPHLTAKLPEDIFNLIHHSDKGVQYCSNAYIELLEKRNIKISMTKRGNPGQNALAECMIGSPIWDNAVAESFFKTLKTELINPMGPKTLGLTKVEVFDFLEIWRPPLRYNRKRIHASWGYLTPMEFETKLNYHQNAA